ncbi:DUF6391 domain-containing protein [Leptolyngbya sp. GB1-A1]|uniref:DUF6391 domain-containing protein n=1 Tax=Leptolyngbya sp. GB1-A1 TaxID=2933908 RepID=UPI00329A5FC3
MAASAPPFDSHSDQQSNHQFPFEFAPHLTQDSELLRQLDFLPGLKELLMVRQVHALEHATAWVLTESMPPRPASAPFSFFPSPSEAEQVGGMSTSEGFYLYGKFDITQLRRATQRALERIVSGEWNLAVHPRCGTNMSVGMLLTAGLAIGTHLVLPREPIGQLLGLGAATMTAMQLAPELGGWAQKYVTTAIPFNLTIEGIHFLGERQGYPTHFVRVKWIDR